MDKISPCLWYDDEAEAAARLYVSLFPDSRIDQVTRSPADYPGGKAGDVLVVLFTLAGKTYIGLNGRSRIDYTNGMSLQVECEDQAEVDRLWDALLDGGGSEMACGWLKDRWGVPWQITPRRLTELLADPDPGRARRAMEAMMEMVKIDIAAIERAAKG